MIIFRSWLSHDYTELSVTLLSLSYQRKLPNRNRIIELENERTITRGKGVEGRRDWKFGIDVYTLLYLRWIIIKYLLNITGNSVQYSVITILLPRGTSSKEPPCQSRRCKRCGFDPWVRKIPWRRKWQPTAVFLLKESHGQRSLAGYGPWGHMTEDVLHVNSYNMAAMGWIIFSPKYVEILTPSICEHAFFGNRVFADDQAKMNSLAGFPCGSAGNKSTCSARDLG